MKGLGGGTLQPDLDEIKRVRYECRKQASSQAGNGLHQNGGDPILGCAHEELLRSRGAFGLSVCLFP